VNAVKSATGDLCKSITQKTIIAACILALAFGILISDWKPWVSGLFFGSIFGVLNFKLLALTLEKSVKKGPSKARNYVMSRYMVRYVLTAIVLFVGFRANYIHVIGVIVGIFLVKVVIFIDQLLLTKRKSW